MKPVDRRHTSRGFASITAIALISIVGLALAALASLFASETRRTGLQRDDAQLRQLLIAGEVATRQALARGERKGAVELPADLAAAGTTLTFAPDGDGDAGATDPRLRVTARTADGRVQSQVLTYRPDGQRWTLRTADLEASEGLEH